MTMACNSSGWYSNSLAGSFGLTSYDWSNAKAQWANAKPMDCEERLVTQASATKRTNPSTHVFVYRNLVKALPWFSTVRQKLDDPAYSGFFLRFKDGANGSYHVPACTGSKCSEFYHDQEQTPAVPTPSDPHPDGSCTEGECDCGKNPCGEYLWDHRNGTMLRDFLINEVILGASSVGHPDIDGLFIDDFWCSSLVNGSHACTDPVQGPSEVDSHNQADMGLSDNDVRDITEAFYVTMTAAQEAILKAKAYTWSLFPGQQNANAMPELNSKAKCAANMRSWCGSHPWEELPLMFGLNMGTNHTLPSLEADLATFLLIRGPYAYLGAGIWGMSWPAGVEWDTKRPTVKRPEALDVDYGSPVGLCRETSPSVFERDFTKTHVKLDCSTYTGTLTPQ
eukprot:TRINITY_DN43531_c0_g1_i1.p1 TRINITY_DN43531_c0_g1~~TRINITY_DN43531_c0_g1_i1.p1  ORF type:complete len:453 (+),score=152.80 TRINITY_DN43531_c0_g1_i1:179-1360(+)